MIDVFESDDDFQEMSLADLAKLDLQTLPENITYNIFEDNFPNCYLSRLGGNLIIRIEEPIYTKYWFHKYHAYVFAEAMIKAIKRLQTEGVPFSDTELDNEDEVHYTAPR